MGAGRLWLWKVGRDPGLLQNCGHDRGLRLAGDDERAQFVGHLQRRYRGDRHPSMREREAAQHEAVLEEAR